MLAALVGTAAAQAQTSPVVHPPLLNIIQSMPEGSWAKVNTNAFSDVWAPEDLRPLTGSANPLPTKILATWSGFGWDTARGDIIFYGGGHVIYSGNEVYRWRSSTLQWERASLPSEIQFVPGSIGTTAIDGADAAPASAHTYDNNIYLPVSDRLLAIGGALYNTGAGYIRTDETNPSTFRPTGPYMFDPAKSDGNKVGGTTGSHVQRVAPHPEVVGGNMWQNRDLPKYLTGQQMPIFINGCTAYAEEGGRDVAYMLGMTGGSTAQDLYRYEVVDVNVPSLDRFSKVGLYWGGPAGVTTACALDPTKRLFVRTGTPAQPFAFFDLTTAGPINKNKVVDNNASIAAFSTWMSANGLNVAKCGMEFDPVRQQFVLWCGSGSIWTLKPPAANGTADWTMAQEPAPPSPVPTLEAEMAMQGGVLGKWRYAPGYDAFMAVATPTTGEVWVYKPVGWQAPTGTNALPTVALTAPTGGSAFTLGAAINLSATAADTDGTILRVEFLANGNAIGQSTTSPYNLTWAPTVGGTYSITARAVDDAGGTTTSAAVSISVNSANVPPTVSLTSPTAGTTLAQGTLTTVTANAADTDGTVTQVDFLANGISIGTSTSSPFFVAWTPSSAGAVSLVARARDNNGATTNSTAVSVTVQAPSNAPPTATLVTPSVAASVATGTGVGLSASATDSDGTVARVEFLANGTIVGTATAAPYAVTWTPTVAGSYAVAARAVDNAGASTTSPSVTITVTAPVATTPTTVTLQRGLNSYTGVADATLSSYSSETTTNIGASTNFREYYQAYTTLIRFAIFQSEGGPVPNGATIQAATLDIYKESYNYTYRLHPILKSWVENQTTWINARTGTAWTTPGAQGAGTDYDATADATVTTGFDPGWMTFDVKARLQAISSGGANNGWRLRGVSGYDGLRYFRSSEYATASFRPRLTVTYVGGDGTPPPAPAAPTIGFTSGNAVGSVSDTTLSSVKVNGVTTPVAGGSFSFAIPLIPGTSNVTIEATNAGGTTTKTITVIVP